MIRWTQSEIDFLEDNVECSNKYLAKKLGRTENAVIAKKYQLRIKKDVEAVMPEPLTQQEKQIRIIKLAADMRVKLKGWVDDEQNIFGRQSYR